MKLIRSVLYLICTGFLIYFIGEKLPRRWFSEDSFLFRQHEWERETDFYRFLNIRYWKQKLPDMSRLLGHRATEKQLRGSATGESLTALIKETCVAEFSHTLLCLLSVRVYAFWKNGVGILLTALCVIGNLSFVLIQRYNRPHLERLRDRIGEREHRKSLDCEGSLWSD